MRSIFILLVLALALFAIGFRHGRMAPNVVRSEVVRSEERAVDSVDLNAVDEELAAPDVVADVIETAGDRARSVPEDIRVAVEFPTGYAMLTVRVMGRSRPIAGAAVDVGDAVTPTFVGDLDDEGLARTDERGRARFFVRPTRTAIVRATLSDTDWSASSMFTTPFEGRDREVILRIANAAAVAGQMERTLEVFVRSFPSLAPIEGASLRADSRAGRGLSLETERTTDEDGRLEVPWQHGLEYVALADGHSQGTARAPVRPGDGPLIIDLPKHARVWGTFAPSAAFHSVNGEPPGTVRLTPVGDTTGRGSVTTTLDPSGNWAIEDIAFPFGKEPSLVFSVDGSLEGSWRAFSRDFTLHAGDDLELLDEWKTAPGLGVEVLYGSGQPVGPDVTFALLGASASFGGRLKTAATQALDSDGRATFAHIPTATWPFELRPFKERRVAFTGAIVHDGAGMHRIAVDGFESISGRIVDAAGSGQANWYVRLVESSPDRASRLLRAKADGSFRYDFVHVGATLSMDVGRLEDANGPEKVWGAQEQTFVPAVETTATPGEHGIEIVVDPR